MDGDVADLAVRKLYLESLLDPAQDLLRDAVCLLVPDLVRLILHHGDVMSASHAKDRDLDMEHQVLKSNVGNVKMISGQTLLNALMDPLDLLRHVLVSVQLLRLLDLLGHISGDTQPSVKLSSLYSDAVIGLSLQMQVMLLQKVLHFLQIAGQSLLGDV